MALEAQAIPEVAVITPKAGPAVQSLTLPGTIQAWYEAPMYARVSGYLKMWYSDYGAHVKKGDVLAEIDTPDRDAQRAKQLPRRRARPEACAESGFSPRSWRSPS